MLNKKTFISWLIQNFGLQIKKMFIKKFSDVTDVYFFISTTVNYK